MTPIEYITNVAAHKNCTAYICHKGKAVILFEGNTFTWEQFESAYPINRVNIRQDKKILKGNNPDTTKDWLK